MWILTIAMAAVTCIGIGCCLFERENVSKSAKIFWFFLLMGMFTVMLAQTFKMYVAFETYSDETMAFLQQEAERLDEKGDPAARKYHELLFRSRQRNGINNDDVQVQYSLIQQAKYLKEKGLYPDLQEKILIVAGAYGAPADSTQNAPSELPASEECDSKEVADSTSS